MIYRLAHFLLCTYFKVAYKHQVFGLHHVLEAQEGCIIAANHTSFLDPPLIGTSIPYPIYFLARASLFRKRIVSSIFHALNAIPLTQQIDHLAFKRAGATKKEGFTLVIFPEGSRSMSGALGPFNKGVALLAKTLRCPVIPTYIDGAFEIWPRTRSFPRLFGKTLVVFGPPISLNDFKQDTKRAQYEAFTTHLEKEIAILKDTYCSKNQSSQAL